MRCAASSRVLARSHGARSTGTSGASCARRRRCRTTARSAIVRWEVACEPHRVDRRRARHARARDAARAGRRGRGLRSRRRPRAEVVEAAGRTPTSTACPTRRPPPRAASPRRRRSCARCRATCRRRSSRRAGSRSRRKRSTDVVGYLMPKVSRHARCTRTASRGGAASIRSPATDVVAALLALHDAIAGLHRAGIVIGDCNDLNVLVDGRRVHLIDVDSYQYAGFACAMFSERFVDPRLCDAQQLVPVRPHDADSDWFAFAVDGVSLAARRRAVGRRASAGECPAPPAARAARARACSAPDIVYPRAARPLAILPDELVDDVPRDLRARRARRVPARAARAPAAARVPERAARSTRASRCPACQAARAGAARPSSTVACAGSA